MVRSRSALDIPASPALLQVVQSLPLLPLTTSNDLDPLLKRIGDARVVMLGEASHGTSEFYTWRAEITRRLVEEKGFNFVAVEGDFADCYRVNRYVKDLPKAAPDATAALNTFKRWPTWMWANAEARSFFEWMRAHNDRHPPVERVGFWGLDTYGLWDSLRELVAYFKDRDADAFEAAQACLSCFELTGDVLRDYARATVRMSHSCEQEAVDLLCRTREAALKVLASDQDGEEGSFIAQENARVVCDAEVSSRPAAAESPPFIACVRSLALPHVDRVRMRCPRSPRALHLRCIPRPTTARWCGAARRAGTCATRTWPTRSASCSSTTATAPRRWYGRTTRTSVTRSSPTCATARRSTSASSAASSSALSKSYSSALARTAERSSPARRGASHGSGCACQRRGRAAGRTCCTKRLPAPTRS